MNYVLDDKGNMIEGYDKEGFLAVLQQAIDNGDLEGIDADSAFVTKLKCCVGGGTFKTAFVTQAIYNQLKDAGQLQANAYYFITDDTGYETLTDSIEDIQTDITNIEEGVIPLSVKKNDGTMAQIVQNAGGVFKIGNDIVVPTRKVIWNSPIPRTFEVPAGSGTTDLTFDFLSTGMKVDWHLIMTKVQSIGGGDEYESRMFIGGGIKQIITYDNNVWECNWNNTTKVMSIKQQAGYKITFCICTRIYE